MQDAPLEEVDSLKELVDSSCRSDGDKTGDCHLQHQAGARRSRDLVVYFEHHVEGAYEHIGRHFLGQSRQTFFFIGWHIDASACYRSGHRHQLAT